MRCAPRPSSLWSCGLLAPASGGRFQSEALANCRADMTQGASWPPLPFSVPITLETGRGSPVVPGRWAVRWVTGGLFSWIYTHWKSLWALAAPSSPHRG